MASVWEEMESERLTVNSRRCLGGSHARRSWRRGYYEDFPGATASNNQTGMRTDSWNKSSAVMRVTNKGVPGESAVPSD
jgi:hypothetical protein